MMMRKLYVQIQGMVCPGCEKIITQVLQDLPGISNIMLIKMKIAQRLKLIFL